MTSSTSSNERQFPSSLLAPSEPRAPSASCKRRIKWTASGDDAFGLYRGFPPEKNVDPNNFPPTSTYFSIIPSPPSSFLLNPTPTHLPTTPTHLPTTPTHLPTTPTLLPPAQSSPFQPSRGPFLLCSILCCKEGNSRLLSAKSKNIGLHVTG